MLMKKKHTILCHSEAEMEMRADALREQGFSVETCCTVRAVASYCFPVYRILYR